MGFNISNFNQTIRRSLVATVFATAIGAFVSGAFVSSDRAWAQDGGVDEVIVTGSFIKQTPGDAPLPVDVITSEDLFNIGQPSVVELIKTIGVSSGVDGETNQFQSNGLEGTANVNLRGLGAGRNLVLLNGRRNVFSGYAVGAQAQLFVDINNIPGVALQRVEILKDGAAATYGSDAVSGVVNFITRSDFEGVEVAASYQAIDGSDNDLDLGVIAGGTFGDTHVVGSFGYQTRGELPALERDWAIQPYSAGGNAKGYTGIPSPGSYFLLPFSGARIRDPRCTSFIGVESANHPSNSRANCTYNYVYFDNLVEKEERYQIFSELTHDFNDTLSLNAEILWAKSEVPEWKSSPSYPPQTLVDFSFATGRFIPSYHPGLVALGAVDINAVNAEPNLIAYDHDADPNTPDEMRPTTGWIGSDGQLLATNPFTALADATCMPTSRTAVNCDALLSFGRPFGISGPSGVGNRDYETRRFVIGLDGAVTDGVDFTTSVLWTETEGSRVSPDTYSERWALALRGFGAKEGTPCTGDEPGNVANGCYFINPFSNSIDVPQTKYATITRNPDYTEALGNDPEVVQWIRYNFGDTVENSLIVGDLVFTGEESDLLSWAAGIQLRRETRTYTPNIDNNLAINPCQTLAENETFRASGAAYDPEQMQCNSGTPNDTTDDTVGSGQFIFLAGATPYDRSQDIIAAFGELALTPHDDVDIQLSLRYEDYGGDVGGSLDPKFAIRWQATDNFVLRASASTTFRGPTVNQSAGRATTLSFVPPTTSFKAVDTFGNPNLDPESALTYNIGFILDYDGLNDQNGEFFASLDYWAFDFEDPIIVESFNDIINEVYGKVILDAMGEPLPRMRRDNDDIQDAYENRITAGGLTDRTIERIRVNIINGPDIETNGVDLVLRYGFDAGDGRLELTGQWNYTLTYDIGASPLNAAFDGLGKLNDNISYLRSIPEHRAKMGLKYEEGPHTFTAISNYVGEYADRATGLVGGGARDVDAFITHDAHYNINLGDLDGDTVDTTFWVSVYNLLDEDPPFARLDLNYDPYTHNPLGRRIKAGVRFAF